MIKRNIVREDRGRNKMAIVMEKGVARIGHGIWLNNFISYGSEDCNVYLDDLKGDGEFDHLSATLVEKRLAFLDSCVDLATIPTNDDCLLSAREKTKKLYVRQFEQELDTSDLFQDCYRYYNLVRVVRGEACAIGHTLLHAYEVELRLPPREVLDQVVTGVKIRLPSEQQMNYPMVAAEALSELTDTVQIT
ncbi:MAG TPA: hypothetical protein VFN56_00275 [Candidatus Saccharimonadales bacterium]|nr:hypothetical protein [Candidatus Saccharimonadales bacterium]